MRKILGISVAAVAALVVSACGSSTASKPVLPQNPAQLTKNDKGGPQDQNNGVGTSQPDHKGPRCSGLWRYEYAQNWETIRLNVDGTCSYDKNTGNVVPTDWCTFVEDGTKLTMTARDHGSLDLALAADCSTITFNDVVFNKK